MSDEQGGSDFCWLIEYDDASGPRFFAASGRSFYWTSEAIKALRFSRREDAEAVAAASRDDWPADLVVCVSEHGFMTPPCEGCDSYTTVRSACPLCRRVFCRACAERPGTAWGTS
jgi:hypothetical protein